MSKIEKALNRARSEGGPRIAVSKQLQTVPVQQKDMEYPSSDMLTAKSVPRAKSSEAIALMHEAHLLNRPDLARNRIIYPELRENGTVQAFREIRTKILQKTLGRNCVIMVTSVSGQSGSSFVALNLSVAFAFDAAKTALLIDCNLRNPSSRKLLPDLQNKNLPGLTDYLENAQMDLAEIIHRVGIERVRVIPSGQKREIPSEYFTSHKMRQLMDSLQQRYPERFIILDAPPMTQSADTQILTELCDYVLVVVPYGRVTHSQIDACVKAIDSKKFLGIVFNNEPRVPNFQQKERIRNPFASLQEGFAQLIRTITNTANEK